MTINISEGELAVSLMMTPKTYDPPQWSFDLPVSVNDTYGDPFIPEQISNTIQKLRALEGQRAPIAIFTKAGYDPKVLQELQSLPRSVPIIIYYSLTGLDEGGIDFDKRVKMIAALKTIFDHVLVFTRPIIRGRNDSPEMLARFADVAAEHTGLLVLGGLHDRYKNKNIEFSVEQQLIDLCDERGVKTFHKTSCAGAYLYEQQCWVHDLGAPEHLDVLLQLGYTFSVVGNDIVLPSGTTGDINFIRMLTRAHVVVKNLISNYNLLTLPSGDFKLEATSSWFAWSENISVCLDCDYCIIKQIEYLKKKPVKIGVHPSRLLDIISVNKSHEVLDVVRLTKMPKDRAGQLHRYGDVRVEKPCFRTRYDDVIVDLTDEKAAQAI